MLQAITPDHVCPSHGPCSGTLMCPAIKQERHGGEHQAMVAHAGLQLIPVLPVWALLQRTKLGLLHLTRDWNVKATGNGERQHNAVGRLRIVNLAQSAFHTTQTNMLDKQCQQRKHASLISLISCPKLPTCSCKCWSMKVVATTSPGV